ncbi:DUF262 domain-containing protein [Salinimicrobium sp. TH3]|uniref:DUF262 domain-containing protein n=1 Tax=Salinimicrobium sp. TH3 TaxID=2997342 RepID=UPI002273087F|nr:DUF262 domain-containing HNH endonuclease family protein [Salinimicrobium sp. TH3]MCY2687570.1 DUF262 domain-containing HNH endonuclease family protein [Salinimicrobium sp. TH3]
MEIDAHVRSIAKLEDYFFIVPDYQREYVWKPDDQVEQFIIDIENEFDPNAPEQNSYFLGSIIIVKNKGKYDVIDGQQRLTTIILALCALRDIMKDLDLDDIQQEYYTKIKKLISDFNLKSKKRQYRLELQYEESKDFLNKLVNSEPFEEDKTASIEKMESAYEKLFAHFEKYKEVSTEGLVDYAAYFLMNIELVIIESENLSSALKIFETINQRGAGLNAMDLVKNLLFGQANESDFEKIKSTWKDITNNLEACGEGQSPLRFLRYFLMSRYHDKIIREDTIYKWIISPEGKAATNYEKEPLKFAKELNRISKRYSDLVTATEYMKDNGNYPFVTNIGFINKYRSRQHLILLLALDTKFGRTEIEYLAKQIESFFFYSNTIGIPAKNNERLFSQWSVKLRTVNDLDELKQVIEETMIPYLKEKLSEFKSVFMNLRHHAYNPLYRQRYFFRRLENTVRSKAQLPLQGYEDVSGMQIEHILPQTPDNGHLPDEFEDKDDYHNFVYKLGNVTLLESQINQAVNKFNKLTSNWFDLKQKEYRNSNLALTDLLDDEFEIGLNTALNRFKNSSGYIFSTWDKEAILKRQKILMDLAIDTWTINDRRLDQ